MYEKIDPNVTKLSNISIKMKREKKYRYDNSSIDGNFYFDENEKEELERKRSKASGCE